MSHKSPTYKLLDSDQMYSQMLLPALQVVTGVKGDIQCRKWRSLFEDMKENPVVFKGLTHLDAK